jgi:predicted ATPase/DNA-binding SARP family transcriptional activator/DNA-binding CsgD family transcriptional regulator
VGTPDSKDEAPAYGRRVGAYETLRIRLLGGFRVSVGARVIREEEWRRKKAASLIKLLALAPGHRLHREQVMELLWPHLDPVAAPNNLRRTLHVARRVLGPSPSTAAGHLRRQGEEVVLCPEGRLWVDVEAFEEAAANARRSGEPGAYRAALALYAGDLLPGDPYEEWAEERRRELRETYVSLLLGLASIHEGRGDYGSAVEALREAIAEELTREEAHVGLIRLYALSGHRAEALTQYERLHQILSSRLGTQPGPSSRALREEIAAGRFPPGGAHPGDSPGERGAPRHNLPATRTGFVGRERELTEVKRALAMTRLLTLTGVGGSGKTRLALEVARDLVGVYPDGVWLVELAPLTEPGLIPQEVAEVLGVREQPGRPLVDTLAEALREKEVLLILDNCEHLVEGCARLVDRLLGSCPRLRVLATSREPLGTAGEALRPVPPLSVPDPGGAPDVEELASYESVQLFVERGRLRLPAFELTAENAHAVLETCRKLEGIPLAVELAASRMGVLAVEQLAERLADSLGLLGVGPRSTAPRQRSMRAALEWSYELLSGQEKGLFARLSVFAGGFTLEAAEAVGAGEGIEERDVLNLLSGLVDKSLVVAEVLGEGMPRYRMLEPVRQYAGEKLQESEEAEQVGRSHALWFLRFAEEAEGGLEGPEHEAWSRRLEMERDNLRAALRWSIDSGDECLSLGLASAQWQFWFEHGSLAEGRGWLEEALSLVGPSQARAKALRAVGYLALVQGDFRPAKAYLEEALSTYIRLGDAEGVASALTYLLFVALVGQSGDVFAQQLEEALGLWPQIENPRTKANMLTLAFVSAITGLGQQDLGEVAALHEEHLIAFRKAGYAWGISTCLANLGLIALAGGEEERAEALFRELLLLSGEHLKMGAVYGLFGLACAASSGEHPTRAARLWGAVEELQRVSGVRLPPLTLSFTGYEGRLAEVREKLGNEVFEEAWAEGAVMTEEVAAEYALGQEEGAGPIRAEQRPTGTTSTSLTLREQEVAELVARGLTNRRIAEQLHLSERTVATHVGRLLKKMGVRSRRQVADRLTAKQQSHNSN